MPGKPAGPADKTKVQSHPSDASMDGEAIKAGCRLLHTWWGGFGFGFVLLRGETREQGPHGPLWRLPAFITSAPPTGTHGGDKSETVTSAPFSKRAMLR